MDPLNVHVMWILKLLTSHKCHFSHRMQIRDSNHTKGLSMVKDLI